MASKVQIHVGDVPIGGGAPVAVQTMTKTETANLPATMAQIETVANRGWSNQRQLGPGRFVFVRGALVFAIEGGDLRVRAPARVRRARRGPVQRSPAAAPVVVEPCSKRLVPERLPRDETLLRREFDGFVGRVQRRRCIAANLFE